MRKVLRQLSRITDVYFKHDAFAPYEDSLFPTATYGHLSADLHLPSESIKRVTFISSVWRDFFLIKEDTDEVDHRLALWDWPVEELVIDLSDQEGNEGTHADMTDIAMLLDPKTDLHDEPVELFTELRRIELRVVPALEGVLREETKKHERAGLSEAQQRILPLIVFVDKDGTETRLLED